MFRASRAHFAPAVERAENTRIAAGREEVVVSGGESTLS
jgi:hypothetical protein